MDVDPTRIRNAWLGRISGCQLGKPVELLSMMEGKSALDAYLRDADALPLRDYVPYLDGRLSDFASASCQGRLRRSEPDDDINYTVLALLLLERHGLELTTADVARAWLLYLPIAQVFTAERAAYVTLVEHAHEHFPRGARAGIDLALCSDNPFNDWIGAQIRADLYGWVLPGRPELAADLASRDAALSHRGDGVYGAAFVAALGAAIPVTDSLDAAVELGLCEIPKGSRSAEAIAFGRSLVGRPDAVAKLHARYAELSPVHVLNNLALVVWGLLSGESDFSAAIGDTVAAGWDTDCNGATVGGLWGLMGRDVPESWTGPWAPRVALSLAGHGEIDLDELVERTVALARRL